MLSLSTNILHFISTLTKIAEAWGTIHLFLYFHYTQCCRFSTCTTTIMLRLPFSLIRWPWEILLQIISTES